MTIAISSGTEFVKLGRCVFLNTTVVNIRLIPGLCFQQQQLIAALHAKTVPLEKSQLTTN